MDIHGKVVDIHEGRIYSAKVSVEGKIITKIEPNGHRGGRFIIPGFVDSHLHLESTLLPPSEFAQMALRHGTIGAICDPVGFATVFGISGIEYLLDNARVSPLKFSFTAPPCVPFDPKRTIGEHLGLEKIEELLGEEAIVALGEIKNMRALFREDPELMAKIHATLLAEKPIDGYGLGLFGEKLAKMVQAHISTDHESKTLSEAREKRDLGLKIAIQEGSAAKNLATLYPLLEEEPEGCFFCTNHLTPDHLLLGHIQLLVKKAVQRGLDPIDAIAIASKNPIERYGLDIGLLQVGDPADFLIVDDLRNFRVLETYINGECVFKEASLFPKMEARPLQKFGAEKIFPEQLAVAAKKGRIHIIALENSYGLTKKETILPTESDGELISDPSRDLLKVVVLDRLKPAAPAIGFIKNFGLKTGAIGSSVAHDTHPLIAIGTNDDDLCRVLNGLVEAKGGLAISFQHHLDLLPLPIGGLLSNLEGEDLARHYGDMKEKTKEMGCLIDNPFLTLSMLTDLALPELKMSEQGMIETSTLELVPIYTR